MSWTAILNERDTTPKFDVEKENFDVEKDTNRVEKPPTNTKSNRKPKPEKFTDKEQLRLITTWLDTHTRAVNFKRGSLEHEFYRKCIAAQERILKKILKAESN
ncbi:hypothetical protein [Candidatus Lokiarchaeum ossiferum]|uniref:hypothetical protein n=1 Tax=Candidatus Lokiarchaeum ossiferum TaxID=2951803 RepID=UPI00352DCB69